MATKIGSRTVQLDTPISVLGYAAIGSKMESQGPLAQKFDLLNEDSGRRPKAGCRPM